MFLTPINCPFDYKCEECKIVFPHTYIPCQLVIEEPLKSYLEEYKGFKLEIDDLKGIIRSIEFNILADAIKGKSNIDSSEFNYILDFLEELKNHGIKYVHFI